MSAPLPTGGVASRFVSQTELTEAQQRRQRELREAYERYVLAHLAPSVMRQVPRTMDLSHEP